jgi:fermentation-respiration switch protein FrsA (DUF1100 family)
MATLPPALHSGGWMGKGTRMLALLIATKTLLVLYGLIATIMFLCQRRILFRPDRTAPNLGRAGVPGVRTMTVTTPDGLELLTWYMPPARDDEPVVLYLHGNAGHIGHRAFRLELFQRLGWGALLLEYRGYGGNPGRPSEAGLTIDARAGLAALLAMGIAPSRILLYGESLGSGLAARLATEQPVRAVVLESPYTSITDIARSRYPFLPVRWLLLDRFDSLRVIGGARAPVLVMHGARDRIVPVAMGRAVFAAAPDPKELWIAPHAGHIDLVEAGAMEAATDFVARISQQAPA